MVERVLQEAQMEDLIAKFPEDFFPGRNLTLQGRQKSFADVGRFDLLFQDGYQTNILMELKKRRQSMKTPPNWRNTKTNWLD